MILALQHLAKQHSQLQMVVRGFEKHMRKQPLSDSEIRGGLQSVRDYIDKVLET